MNVQYYSSGMPCRSLVLTLRTWRTILNIRKLKPARNFTLLLSVVTVLVEIFHKLPEDDTVNSHYDDKTAIWLFLRAFKLFSQQFWLFLYLSTYQMKLFCIVPSWLSVVVDPSLRTARMTVSVVVHEIFKTHGPLLHYLWVGPNDRNTFGNTPWNNSHRKISYKDSFNSVIFNVWKMPISRELPICYQHCCSMSNCNNVLANILM